MMTSEVYSIFVEDMKLILIDSLYVLCVSAKIVSKNYNIFRDSV